MTGHGTPTPLPDARRAPAREPGLVAHAVTRRFGAVIALDGVDLRVDAGEIVGLLGQNGAGKSTLISILSGSVRPDNGDVLIDGSPVGRLTPARALALGVGAVHQHFALVPSFTVAEQLRLAGAPGGAGDELLADIGRDRLVSDLASGERQRLEIGRVLACRPRFLLLDEPTSMLDGTQVDTLFHLLGRLRETGMGILLVTHRLDEVLRVVDRVVTLRDGRTVGELRSGPGPVGRWPFGVRNRLVNDMFGENLGEIDAAGAPETTPLAAHLNDISQPSGSQTENSPMSGYRAPVVSVQGLSGRTVAQRHRPQDIWFDIAPGETLAVVGIDGQGQRPLAAALAGLEAAVGLVVVDGVDLGAMEARARYRRGLSWLTDDRVGEGGVGRLSLALNLTLRHQRERSTQRIGLLRRRSIRATAAAAIAEWGISPSAPGIVYGALSGGNMQKVLLARELTAPPRFLIATNPTHGLDVRTERLVWAGLRRVTDAGGAVLLITPDIGQALRHADQVAVLAGGRLSRPVPVAETSRAALAGQLAGLDGA